MEKISRIVPNSHRVSSVDLKNAPPVRPGTPSFGRPVGISTLAEEQKQSTAEKALAVQKDLLDKRSLSDKGPQMVQTMADRFFLQNRKSADEPVKDFDINVSAIPQAEAVPSTTSNALEFVNEPLSLPEPMESYSPSASAEEMSFSPENLSAEEREFTPPGSYLDVHV